MKNKNKLLLPLAAVFFIVAAFTLKVMLKGVDTASMDTSAKPQDDFYQYTNGNWCKNNPVPSSEARWSNFNIISDRNNELLHKIMKEASVDKKATTGSVRKKVGDFYRIAMDTIKLEAEGIAPLRARLQEVDQLNSKEDLIQLIGRFHQMGIPALFDFEISQDVKNSSQYICYFSQGGLGLPDRDYYFKEDEKSRNIRREYEAHITTMFNLAGIQSADGLKSGNVILPLETKLAEKCMTRTERRDMEKQYNKKVLSDLVQEYDNIRLDNYTNLIGLAGNVHANEVVIMQPEFFKNINNLLATVPMADWKVYLKWKLLHAATPYLNSSLQKETFRFYGTVMQGTKEQKPRWKRVIASANQLIGELVAQEFVKVAFSPEAKEKVNKMVDNLRDAFRDRISKLDWMSEPTKQKALEKLNSFSRKLGYPDKWKDYSKLDINYDNYLFNYFRASQFHFNEMLDKLGKPVDRTEWEMLPQTVNAYYNPVNNEIVFPAAIMQPPFFDPMADDAINYGAIGAVIGHEFSHGFDDQGSKYDAAGNLNDWWTSEDRSKFDQRAEVLTNQFSKFKVEENVFVNGKLTLGENIADFAGLTVAYDAYQRSLLNGKKTNIDGFTPEQRFFIAYGQVWRTNARPEFLRQQVVTDPHSPGRFRVLGPLSNMPQFYEAFQVKAGDKMHRTEAERARIW
jgi:putative endopeptidase